MALPHLLFLGTYTRSGTSKGIYSLQLDGATGALGVPKLAAEIADPGWITLSPDRRRLYAVQPIASQAVGFEVDADQGTLIRLDAPAGTGPATAPAHLAIDATGRVLLAANYHEGYVAAVPLGAGGSPGQSQSIRHSGRSVHPTRQDKAHVHSVTVSPDNRHVVVADLGTDQVHTYALDLAGARLTSPASAVLAAAPGAGPRHAAFGRDGRFLYVVNELHNTVLVCGFAAARGELNPLQTVSTLPNGSQVASTAAEIRVHPNGQFIYTSNRGYDSADIRATTSSRCFRSTPRVAG
ncbi:MAG: lactonase family protein [Verrucomicrobia bacterium]|nr:lactonase family protein [Verrucomicrobiota bacterium]